MVGDKKYDSYNEISLKILAKGNELHQGTPPKTKIWKNIWRMRVAERVKLTMGKGLKVGYPPETS